MRQKLEAVLPASSTFRSEARGFLCPQLGTTEDLRVRLQDHMPFYATLILSLEGKFHVSSGCKSSSSLRALSFTRGSDFEAAYSRSEALAMPWFTWVEACLFGRSAHAPTTAPSGRHYSQLQHVRGTWSPPVHDELQWLQRTGPARNQPEPRNQREGQSSTPDLGNLPGKSTASSTGPGCDAATPARASM